MGRILLWEEYLLMSVLLQEQPFDQYVNKLRLAYVLQSRKM